MPKLTKIKTIALLGLSMSSVASAGEPTLTTKTPIPEEPTRNWCDAFDTIDGPLYKNSDNPFLQEFDIFGRVHWQHAYVDGEDVDGNDFHDSFDEWRRIRIGAEAKFFQYFTFKANVDLMDDRRPGGGASDFSYQGFDKLRLTTNIGKMIGTGGFDSLKVTAGRMKIKLSQEAHVSSRKLKTPERSALSRKAFNSGRGTGILLDADKGDFTYNLGVFGDEDEESLGGFDNGLTYYASIEFEASKTASYFFDFAYNDGDIGTEADFLQYDWAVSVAGIYDYGRMEFMWNTIYGENNETGDRDGAFYGVILMPSYWLIEKKLEAVVRYQYQASEEDEGIRLNSRYLRRADRRGVADFDGGRGNENHNIYAGLNWHLCGHNLKLMSGVEYEKLEAPLTKAGDAEAFTYWFVARTYF